MHLQKLGIGLFALCLIAGSIPQHAHASHQDRSTSSYYGGGERYSNTVSKAVKKLGSKEVEDLKIPVLLGITRAKLSPNFGDARGGGTRTHEGLDIMAPEGAFVASPTDAVVIAAGDGESSGIYVTTANPGGERFVYMHLSGIADGVKTGTVLEEGDLIGYVGNTGNASGGAPHLHFEIREGREVKDPYERLTKEFTSQERIAVLMEILKELQKELARKK